MATFWERAAHSVDHMFSLYSDHLLLLFIPLSDTECVLHVDVALLE